MDDYEDYDESQQRFEQNFIGGLKRLQRMMFLHDLELHRSSERIQIDPSEFVDMFDEPTDEDMYIMTQLLIQDIHDFNNSKVIDKWGIDWIKWILEFNVDVEEYELCARFKEVMDSAK